MSLRIEKEIRKFHEQFQEEQERPLKQAVAALDQTTRELYETLREAALRIPLDDIDPTVLAGFERAEYAFELNPVEIRAAFEQFQSEPGFKFSEHFEPIRDFLILNNLQVSYASIKKAFELLCQLHIIEPHVPQPEPEKPIVNLEIAEDPETIRQKRIREYEEKPVARYQGRDYSQRELDALPADEYRRVMRIPRTRAT
jgi:hypothetical protein